MKKLKFLTVLIALIFSVAAFTFTACESNSGGVVGNGNNSGNTDNENTDDWNNDDENTGNGNTGGDKEPQGVEIFGLAEEIANINIVTADGQDITGDEDNQEYKTAKFTVTNGRDGENFESVPGKVRVRGNNTAGYDKKSFRLKFDSKINLFGLNNGAKCKNWVLLASYKDVSFLRDAVTFEFAKQSPAENGYYSSDYCFAEVSINGKYNGLYLVAEQQQVNPNRVDVYEPVEGYTGTDIGYLVEYDGNAYKEPVGVKFSVSYSSFPLVCEDGKQMVASQYPFVRDVMYTVKNDMYGPNPNNTEQLRFITEYTKNVFKILYDAIYNGKYTTFNSDYTAIVPADFTDARSAVEAVVNLDSWVDMFILQEIACDNDIDWSSFFFSVDMSAGGDKKLTFQAPWDFDSGFGMMKGLEELDKIFTANSYTNAMHGLNPWTALPAHADWFMKVVAERWNELKERGVFTRLTYLIETVTETYKPYFEKNYTRWDNLGKIVDPVQSETLKDFKSQSDASDYLKNWLSRRINFLDKYFKDLLK